VVIGVSFPLFGGDCGDGVSKIFIGVVVTVMVMMDKVSGYGFSTLFSWWVMI